MVYIEDKDAGNEEPSTQLIQLFREREIVCERGKRKEERGIKFNKLISFMYTPICIFDWVIVLTNKKMGGTTNHISFFHFFETINTSLNIINHISYLFLFYS